MSDKDWYIKSYNTTTHKSRVIVKTLPGAEDFELLNDGTLIMASGNILYKYTPEADTEWKAVVDMSDYGIEKITRIAAQKNRLLIVDQKS